MTSFTIESLMTGLRHATVEQLTTMRSLLGIITIDPPTIMAAPSIDRPLYADFFQKSTKPGNDAANKRREAFLATLYNMELAADAPEQLRKLHSGWQTAINSLCPTEFASIRNITNTDDKKADGKKAGGKKAGGKKAGGGRGNNHDFIFEYLSADGTVVHTQKVEFKQGAKTIEKQPQILSLASKSLNFPLTYAEFYYDNFLKRYCETDTGINIAPPPREIYLKIIYQDKYDSHPFFKCIYDREETAKKAKAAIVNKSISTYLAAYADKCDLTQLNTLMIEKQKDKAFLLWDMSTFHVKRLTTENLTPIANRGVSRGNTIDITTATHVLKLLLRWKNHKGVLFPAWQISLKQECLPLAKKGKKKTA